MIGNSSHGLQGQGNTISLEIAPVAMANHVSTTTPLARIPPNLKHSIFAAKMVNRSAYSCNTCVLDIGATNHIICLVSLLTTITSVT